jgi:hypothetical protein
VPAKQLATIRPYALEIIEAHADENWCATFEANANSEHWVQLMHGTINAAYPYDDDPMVRLERHGLAGQVGEMIAFEAKAYATFTLKEAAVTSSAEFVDAWFSTILAVGDGYTLEVQLEDHG